MVRIPLLCLVVITIAAFGPPTIRGVVILLCSLLALWFTRKFYSPFEATPDLPPPPEDPAIDAAQQIIVKHSVKRAKTKK